jgi:membrane peptidoglycan carboxypeptidase
VAEARLPLDVDTLWARRERRARRAHGRGHLGRALLVAALVLAILAGSAAAALTLVVHDPGLVAPCNLATAPAHGVGSDSFVYASDGSRLGTVPTSRNREPVALSRMSRWLPLAAVAIEDRRFWQHGALDYQGIARAAVADLQAGHVVQGASTITQQLVRDRYFGGRRVTVHQKLAEACLAVQLAQRESKRQILGAYLNQVFFGNQAYGAEAAARTYFSRPARDLTLAQAALLAGLPQAPSRYDPLVDPRAALARRAEVLAAMQRAGYVSATRARRAAARPLRLHPGGRYAQARQPTFLGFALRELDAQLGPRRARRGGLRVDTTLDPHLQQLATRAIDGWLNLPTDPAAALVAIDPRNGAIRAMAAVNPSGRRLRFNLATQSRRQAGSAFKVFTLTAALERGIPLSSVWNGPPSLTIPNRECLNANGPWVVHNFADETSGTMNLAQAIAHSVNTIFAQVAVRVGPGRIVAVAHRMGIRSPLTPVCSITLGPEGVSPLEMADAFATLAAGGVHHDAHALQRVTTAGGGVVASDHSRGTRAVPPAITRQVSAALTGVIRDGTATAANPGRPAAGKTGTAENFEDAWFCGYVPQLATCVWVGYPSAETPLLNLDGFPQVVGGSIPARIWHDFMVPALHGVPVKPLPGGPLPKPLPLARRPAVPGLAPPTPTPPT